MPTKANGPLMEDYKRALIAADKQGWEEVSVKFPNGSEIAIKKKGGEGAAGAAIATLEKAKAQPPELSVYVDERWAALERARQARLLEQASVVEQILHDGAWTVRQPWKALAAELAKRGYFSLRAGCSSQPMHSTDAKELWALATKGKVLPPVDAPSKLKLNW